MIEALLVANLIVLTVGLLWHLLEHARSSRKAEVLSERMVSNIEGDSARIREHLDTSAWDRELEDDA